MANIAAIAIQIQANTSSLERGLGTAQAGLKGLAASSGTAMNGVSQAVAQGLGSVQSQTSQAASQFASFMNGFTGQLQSGMSKAATAVQPGAFQRLLAPIQAVKSAVDRWTDLPGVRQLKSGIDTVNQAFDQFLQRRYGALAKPIKFAGMGLDMAAMTQGMVLPGVSILGSLGAAAVTEGTMLGTKVGRSIGEGILAAAAWIRGAVTRLVSGVRPAAAATTSLGAATTTAAASTSFFVSGFTAAAAAANNMAAGSTTATAAVAGLGAASTAAGGNVTSFGNILKVALLGSGVGMLIGTLTTLAKKILDVRGTLSRMHEAANTAGTLGITTRALGSLRRIAQEVQVPVETLDAGLSRLQRSIGEAGNPTTEMAAAFRVLGLDARNLAAIPLDQAMGRVADQINALPDPASRAAAVVSVFGRSGQQLLDVLQRGSAGFEAMQASMASMGQGGAGASAEAVTVAFVALEKAFSSIAKIVATAVAPTLTSVVKVVSDIVEVLGGLFRYIGNLVQGFALLAGAVGVFHALRLGIGQVTAGVKALKAAMLGHPILALAAGIIAIVSIFVDWSDVIDLVKRGVGLLFDSLKTWLGVFLEGIAVILDALSLLPNWLGGGHFERWAAGVRSAAQTVMNSVQSANNAAANGAQQAQALANAYGVLMAQTIANANQAQLQAGGFTVPITIDTTNFEGALAAARQFRDRFMAQVVAPTGQAADQLQKSINQAMARADFEDLTRGMSQAEREIAQFRAQGATSAQLAGLVQRQQASAARELVTEVDNASRSMREQAETMGMTTREAQIYRLERRGVSEMYLEELRLQDMMLSGMEEMNRLQQEANRIREAGRTPLEQFRHGMEELQRMMALGVDLSTDDAARQVQRLMSQLEGTVQRTQARAPSGLQRGSSEALSAINQARIEGSRGSESANERLERILEQAQRIEERQEQHLQEIRDALVSGDIFGTAGI